MAGEGERAYQKSLFLLERRDYTEAELRQKLKNKDFSSAIIDDVVLRLKEYGLINDRRFVEQYLRYHGKEYSRRILSLKLLQKGIKAELFDSVYGAMLEEYDSCPEQEALQKALEAALRKAERKGLSRNDLSQDEKKRIVAALYRKGFLISQINAELKKAVELA